MQNCRSLGRMRSAGSLRDWIRSWRKVTRQGLLSKDVWAGSYRYRRNTAYKSHLRTIGTAIVSEGVGIFWIVCRSSMSTARSNRAPIPCLTSVVRGLEHPRNDGSWQDETGSVFQSATVRLPAITYPRLVLDSRRSASQRRRHRTGSAVCCSYTSTGFQSLFSLYSR